MTAPPSHDDNVTYCFTVLCGSTLKSFLGTVRSGVGANPRLANLARQPRAETGASIRGHVDAPVHGRRVAVTGAKGGHDVCRRFERPGRAGRVGALVGQELLLASARIDELLERYPVRGLKGALRLSKADG